MARPGHGRAPAARSWLASLVLIIALAAYVTHAMIQLRRGIVRTTPAPSASVSPPTPGSEARDK
jgi:hypothetical protein